MPEARLELARLASEVFETSASTIPPLGPATWGLAARVGGVNGDRERKSTALQPVTLALGSGTGRAPHLRLDAAGLA